MTSEAAELFSPIILGSLKLSNRVVVSPMCQYSSEDGFANDWHLVHLGSRAVGGASLIFVEATAVCPEGRITPKDMGLWKDEQIEKLRQIARFTHSQGSYIGIQLAHAGRKASMSVPWEKERLMGPEKGGWTNVVAPSAIPFADHYARPIELDQAGIRKVVADFVAATERAKRAEFDVIEIHSAHGYLLHEFLSPLSNKRTDEYGGSFENRTRLLLEVVDAVRGAWPAEMPLVVRISATDWAEGGWDADQSVALAKILKTRGVALMDISSGGLVPNAKIPVGPGFQTPFAERIRREAGIPTGTVGMITDPAQADHIVRTGQADLVLLARELLRDPYWPLRAGKELHKKVSWPAQYLRAASSDTPARDALAD
jgi:2,4-dienoyl-CoA reductase-like NADH-dependent reductase (Old Yellow Enzyme family)